MYRARLRLHGGTEAARERVRDLLQELGLDHVAAVRMGSESRRGISGGEKRRVSIGVDLVHDPAVLLIDEPTSGPDSASALHVLTMLKSMAKNQGKTILLSIHQPRFRILELFDRVILLSGGLVVHNGPLDCLEERLKSTLSMSMCLNMQLMFHKACVWKKVMQKFVKQNRIARIL